jgi:hypothetical protein
MVNTCVFFSFLDGDNDPVLPHHFLDNVLNFGLLHLHLPCSALLTLACNFFLQLTCLLENLNREITL